MKNPAFRALDVPSLVVCAGVTLFSACSTPSGKHAGPPYVRKVDYSAVPQMKALAERARQTGNQMYPRVCALLADGDWDFPPQFDICFKKKLPRMRTGEARLTQICLNSKQPRHCPATEHGAAPGRLFR
jgi:hypothetical protein